MKGKTESDKLFFELMSYEKTTCPRCCSRNIVKNGTTANRQQRYLYKDCRRQFITPYTYRACQPQLRQLVLPWTLNASGIRDISRVLQISPNPVLAILKAAAWSVAEPPIASHIENLEVDEFRSLVGNKANQRSSVHSFCKFVVEEAYATGRSPDSF